LASIILENHDIQTVSYLFSPWYGTWCVEILKGYLRTIISPKIVKKESLFTINFISILKIGTQNRCIKILGQPFLAMTKRNYQVNTFRFDNYPTFSSWKVRNRFDGAQRPSGIKNVRHQLCDALKNVIVVVQEFGSSPPYKHEHCHANMKKIEIFGTMLINQSGS
jgi:hypothetical protein